MLIAIPVESPLFMPELTLKFYMGTFPTGAPVV